MVDCLGQVQHDPELARGLNFQQLQLLSSQQAKFLAPLQAGMDRLGEHFSEVLNGLERTQQDVQVVDGRVAYSYLGTNYRFGSWQSQGRTQASFMGNVYRSGSGWVAKYKTAYRYRQINYKWNHYYEYYK